MSAPTFASAFPSEEAYDEFLKGIGLEVIRIAVTCEVMGWSSPRGAVPYMHAKPSPAWDLVLWTIGSDKEAAERMRGLGAEWAPAVMTAYGDALMSQLGDIEWGGDSK